MITQLPEILSKPALKIERCFHDGDFADLSADNAHLPNFPLTPFCDGKFIECVRELALNSIRTYDLHERAIQDFPNIGYNREALLLYNQLRTPCVFISDCWNDKKEEEQMVTLAIFSDPDDNVFYKTDISADRVQAMLEDEIRLNLQQLDKRPRKIVRIGDRRADVVPHEMALEMRKALIVARDNFEKKTGRKILDTARIQEERNQQIKDDYFKGKKTITGRLAAKGLREQDITTLSAPLDLEALGKLIYSN